jgi:hypothetical protein
VGISESCRLENPRAPAQKVLSESKDTPEAGEEAKMYLWKRSDCFNKADSGGPSYFRFIIKLCNI